jgi:hypothetical protein
LPETALFARLMPDGLVHYGVSAAHDPKLEPLHFIRVSGERVIPLPPGDGSTTPQEHEGWLQGLRNQGFIVEDHIAAPGQELQTILMAQRKRPGSRAVGMPELRRLPLLASVALATRSARRVLYLFRTFHDSPDRVEMHRAVDDAIEVAEKVAAGSSGREKAGEVGRVADMARRVTQRLVPPPADNIARVVADVIAAAAAALQPELDAEKVISHVADAIWTAANTVAFAKAVAGDMATGSREFGKMLSGRLDDMGDEGIHNAVARDYDQLLALNLGRFPDVGAGIDPTAKGPLGDL